MNIINIHNWKRVDIEKTSKHLGDNQQSFGLGNFWRRGQPVKSGWESQTVLVIQMFIFIQVVAELNSTYSVEAIFNSSNALSYANGTWSATLTGLSEGTRYKIFVKILDSDLRDPIMLLPSNIFVLTASSMCIYQLFCSISNIPSYKHFQYY